MKHTHPNTTFDTRATEARLQAMSEMVEEVAHSCMNTLMPITAYTELLLRRPQDIVDTEKVTDYLEQMQLAAEQTVESIRALRQMRARVQLQNNIEVSGDHAGVEDGFDVHVRLKHASDSTDSF